MRTRCVLVQWMPERGTRQSVDVGHAANDKREGVLPVVNGTENALHLLYVGTAAANTPLTVELYTLYPSWCLYLLGGVGGGGWKESYRIRRRVLRYIMSTLT